MIEDATVIYRWQGPPAIELLRGRAVLPSGLTYTAHWMVTGDGRSGVVVCALRDEDLLFVHSPRPAVGETLLELPRGFGDANSAGPTDDAVRELREETGHAASSATHIAEYLTDTSVLPSSVHVVLCTVDLDIPAAPTDGETAGIRWVPLRDVGGLIEAGVLRDGHTLAALATIARLWATPSPLPSGLPREQ
ncbi:MAG TPA: NUDIX hydrolase [Arachnia sp.]|nr:NUDIX hydrolase [Arachnia sp.]HMT85752.1 NUDIX hydrolase [Arachnia sp.]